MNVRKNIDYTEMYEALDVLMGRQLPQMELYWEIGRVVCRRNEKGAAVMASEYLNKHYPDAKGFSPRSLRRMREFYRTYENNPVLLSLAMKLGWTQNVVIMEADLTMDLREWYMKAVKQFEWSKTELIASIAENAHEVIVLAIDEVVCLCTEAENETDEPDCTFAYYKLTSRPNRFFRSQGQTKNPGRGRWRIMLYRTVLGFNIDFKWDSGNDQSIVTASIECSKQIPSELWNEFRRLLLYRQLFIPTLQLQTDQPLVP